MVRIRVMLMVRYAALFCRNNRHGRGQPPITPQSLLVYHDNIAYSLEEGADWA